MSSRNSVPRADVFLKRVDAIDRRTWLGQPSFSADGSLLAVGTAEGLIEVWDIVSGATTMLTRQHGDSVNDVLFAPDSNTQLISASDDTTVAQWPCRACADQDAVIREALDKALPR